MLAHTSETAATDRCSGPCPYPKLASLVEYLESLDHRADLGELQKLLAGVQVTRQDIAPCCVFGTKGYKRNTISSSPWYELLALCWRSGDFTPIHDHQGVSCAFKVIEGVGTEIRFENTASGLICPVQTVRMEPGYICAANDPDIHQVANMQPPGTDLITLHMYSPPIKKMNTYQFACRLPEECANKYKSGDPAADTQSAEFPC